MINNPKVSIIIPVYNTEKFIKKCLLSILLQTYENYECIIVDDGSTDKSILIAKDTIGNDSRFIFLEQENGGQGSARNLGINHAKGKYLSFIDSDDYVEINFLENLLTTIIINDADICTCNVKLLDNQGKLINEFVSKPEKYLSSKDLLNTKFYISNWMCNKLFHKKVFDKLRFDQNIRTYEDAHIMFRLIYGKNITHVNKSLYNYIQHYRSTSNSIKPTYINDRLSIVETQFKFAKEIGITDQNYLNYVYLKTFVFFCTIKIARFSNNYYSDVNKLKKSLDFEIFNNKNIIQLLKIDKKVGLSLLLFKTSPYYFRIMVRKWFEKQSI